MQIDVTVKPVVSRTLAAVQCQVAPGAVASAWRAALDQVWAFLRESPGLRTDGHNVFLYRHPSRRGESMVVDFGVEVSRSFTPSGAVHETTTPAGDAAVAVHHGDYGSLHVTHEAIHEWARQNGRTFGGFSWEIYGDWSNDRSQLETTVVYLLAETRHDCAPPESLKRRAVDGTMNSVRVAIVVLGLLLDGCSTVPPCAASPGADLGGWMVSEDPELGVHHTCATSGHRFVLQALVERNAQGQVTRWDELTDLVVRVHAGERLMYGLECGSGANRGDVIAVIADRTEKPLRAWRIDTSARQFVQVSPQSITCESFE